MTNDTLPKRSYDFRVERSKWKSVMVRIKENKTGKTHSLLYAQGVENIELRAIIWVANAYNVNPKFLSIVKKGK